MVGGHEVEEGPDGEAKGERGGDGDGGGAEVGEEAAGAGGEGGRGRAAAVVVGDEVEPDRVVDGLGEAEEEDEAEAEGGVEARGEAGELVVDAHAAEAAVEAGGGVGEGEAQVAEEEEGEGGDEGEGEPAEAAAARAPGPPEGDGDEIVGVGEEEVGGAAEGGEGGGEGGEGGEGEEAARGAGAGDEGDEDGGPEAGDEAGAEAGGDEGGGGDEEGGAAVISWPYDQIQEICDEVRDAPDDRAEGEEPEGEEEGGGGGGEGEAAGEEGDAEVAVDHERAGEGAEEAEPAAAQAVERRGQAGGGEGDLHRRGECSPGAWGRAGASLRGSGDDAHGGGGARGTGADALGCLVWGALRGRERRPARRWREHEGEAAPLYSRASMTDRETPTPTPREAPREAPILRRPGPILRLLGWLTEPSLVKGIALGVVMSLVVMVANKLDALWYAVSGLLVILVALLFGAIVGHYVYEGRRRRLQRDAAGLLAEAGAALPALSEDLLALVQTRDRHHLHALWARLGRVRPAARELVLLGVAMVFRVMAMSSLFAVLGGAISFAVFLATYLQVERMGEQNTLLRAQNDFVQAELRAVYEQSNVDAALSVAAQRQTIVLGLMNAVDAEISLRKEARMQADGLDEPSAAGEREVRLSAGMYRRITRTLAQLQPYYAVEPILGEVVEIEVGAGAEGAARRVRLLHRVSTALRSPEQEMLVRFLEGSHVDLSQVILRRAFLEGADLRELELAKIDLSEARLAGAALAGADLSGAYLEGATLGGASLERAILVKAKLGGADLRRAQLGGADLSGASLGGADLTLAELRAATLDKANLEGASLAGADLKDADLLQVKLKDADLTGADLSAVNKAPAIEAIRGARSWWLAGLSDEAAAKLGLSAERVAANKEAIARLRAPGQTPEGAATILEELRASAPTAP